MDIILGVDIGGSTTKIVGLYEDGTIISTLRVKSPKKLSAFCRTLKKYMCTNNLTPKDIKKFVVTGMGAALIKEDILGIPTEKVGEFSAIGYGGLKLSGLKEALVVSMGTGTAFVYANEKEIRHVGGSGVGGGTLSGLCDKLLGVHSFAGIKRLSAKGELGKVDLTIGEMSIDEMPELSANITAANFGSIKEGANDADICAGMINMILQTIGTMCIFSSRAEKVENVVLVGALTTLPQAPRNFELFSKLYGVNFIIADNATFAPAIGAALFSNK